MSGVNKFVNSCMACGQALKWIPVIFIVTVIVWSYYAYVVQLCFFFAETVVQQVFYLVMYHILLVMLCWSYWQTIFVPVGTVPKQFRLTAMDLERFEQAEGLERHQQILEEIARNLPVLTRTPIGPRYCEKCVHIKPDRCHHCSVCGVCVTKMDHHCPWVNNCVGFSNYKFFILFLGYAFVYCIFIAFTSVPYFVQFWKVPNEGSQSGTGKFHILFLFFVSIMFSISLVSLWGYHIYLVLHNRSTLEAFRAPIFRSGPDKDGFSLGKLNNFIEVFGERKLYWFLPIFTSLGDGVIFKSRQVTAAPVVASASVTCYNSMDPSSPLPPPPNLQLVPQLTTEPTVNMGDGISFPQRNVDEDEDSLLGGRDHHRWAEEGGVENNTRTDANPYHVVNLDPTV